MSSNGNGSSYDVVVIGGGPGGSTAATLLAQYGYRVLVIEKEEFPRFSIGESLMPETYWTFKRLGILDKLRKSDYPRKYSVQFISASGKESLPFYFFHTNPHESSVTWQVIRSEFDKMMLDNAGESGAEIRIGSLVREVLFEGDRAVGVRVVADGGGEEEIRSRVVVDASGRNSLIAKRPNLQRPDPDLKKASIFAHYENGLRDSGIDEGVTLIVNTPDNNGWFWFIPLSKNIVSVGVVSSPSYLFEGRVKNPERVLDEEIEACPKIKERLLEAKRISDTHVLSDFSYRSSECAGEGWVLVGDAYGFLDPIYSSGVFLAVKSGEFAADAVHGAFQADDFSRERLGSWKPVLDSGMEAIRKLVFAFYNPEFSFGQFIKTHPQYLKNLVDLLVGDVFKDEVHEIFTAMSEYCDLPEEW